MAAVKTRSSARTTKSSQQPEQKFSLIPVEKLHAMYAFLWKSRFLAEQGAGESFAASTGREAINAAAALDLRRGDTLLVSEHDLFPGLVAGTPLPTLLSLAHRGLGRTSAEARSLAPLCDVRGNLAARLHLATGAALAHKVRSDGQISMIFTGDESAASADWEQALAFAAAQELPVLFLCGGAPLPGRKTADLAARAKSFGVPAIVADANDAVAVYRVVYESMQRARLGRGPTLIDCRPFVLETPRKSSSLDADAISILRQYLQTRSFFPERMDEEIAAAFRKEWNAARRSVKTTAPPISKARVKSTAAAFSM